MLVGRLNLFSSLKINKNSLFIYLAIFFGLFRLYLTSDRDILATNSPHDEFWYISYAYNLFGSKDYDNLVMAHLPIYSYFLLIGSKLGISARLLIDLSWLLGSFYLSNVIYKKTNRNILISIGIYTFLTFHPYVIHYFDRALSENLLSCITLFLLALGIEIALDKDVSLTKVLIFSAVFGISYNVRKEGIVLLAPMIMLWICYLISIRKYPKRDLVNNRITKSVIFSVISIIFISLMISGVNHYQWKSFTKNELTSAGYSAAMKSLISIDAGPTPYQTSVTMDMLMKGEEYSPTLKELNQHLIGSTGKGWMGISEEATEIQGEIGNGWFYWALRDSAAAAGWYTNPKLADEKYKNLANELNQSFASGQLKKRAYVVSPFLDPDYAKWVRYIFPTFVDLVKLLLYPNEKYLEVRSEDASTKQMQEYVQIAGRRNLLPSLEVSGWIQGDESYSALFYNENSMVFDTIKKIERPDVKGAYSFNLKSNFGVLPNKVCFYKTSILDGNCLSLESIKTGSVVKLGNHHLIGIDQLAVMNSKTRRLDAYLPILCKAYDYLTIALIILSAMILIFRAFKRQLNVMNVVFFFAILVFIASRLSLFSVLGASSWSAMQARYLMPLIPFIALIIFPAAWYIKRNDI